MQDGVFRINDVERSHAGDPGLPLLWYPCGELPEPINQEIQDTPQRNACPCGAYKLIWLGGKLGAGVKP